MRSLWIISHLERKILDYVRVRLQEFQIQKPMMSSPPLSILCILPLQEPAATTAPASATSTGAAATQEAGTEISHEK